MWQHRRSGKDEGKFLTLGSKEHTYLKTNSKFYKSQFHKKTFQLLLINGD
jgi:hypothetical protein